MKLWCWFGAHTILDMPQTAEDREAITQALSAAARRGVRVDEWWLPGTVGSEVCVRCGRVLRDGRTDTIRAIRSHVDQVLAARAALARARGEAASPEGGVSFADESAGGLSE